MYFLKKYRRGIFNRYMKGRPVSEVFTKDLIYVLRALKNFAQNRGRIKNLLVYPHYPSKRSIIYKLSNKIGYNLTNKPTKRFEGAIYWEYYTFRTEFTLLEKIAAHRKVINLHSRDISKTFVDQAFNKIFGYSGCVDPLQFHGKIVRKSDLNAMHDGYIMDGPIAKKEDGFIYQLLIDNRHDEYTVMDIRVPVIGQVTDFVYLKYRQIQHRFKNTTNRTDLKETSEVLTNSEVKQLNDFCSEIHLEYGELDVLRHTGDGKIYIVDVNNTPHGPPAHLSKKERKIVLDKMAKLLREYIQNS